MGAVISSGCVRMQEQEPEENPGPGEAVPSATLTVNAVTKHTDPEVKVSFGATDATWEDGDKLFLIKSDGTTITMDLDEGAGTTTGRFISTDPVTAGTYIPYAVSGTSLTAGYVTVTDGIISLDLSVPGGGTLADALAHDILKGNAVALTEGQTVATITNLSTHILSYLRFRFSCNSKSITGIGVSSAGGIATSVSIAPDGTISGQSPTTDEIDLTEVGDDGAGTYSGYFAVYGSTSTSLLTHAEDEDGGKYARLVSTKTANYSAGLVYGRDYTLTDGMVSCAAEATLSEQTWENLGLSVRWAKFNYGSADEYSYDRNVENSKNAVPAGWTGWRFPTRAEVQELFYACNRQWVSGTSNGVRFEAPNGNTLSMGAGGKYRVRDDGNDWTNGEGSDLYFYIDETTTSNGYLSRLYAVIGGEGQSLGFDYANHGGNVYSYDDYLALRLVCDYAEGVDPEKVYVDLSAGGTANCYIVPGVGHYKFRATVKGNGAGDLAGVNKDTDAGTIAKAELVWASYGTATAPLDGELIRNIAYEDGYVYFSSGQVYREGNAVVAVKDGSDKILWSWHLWFTDAPVTTSTVSTAAGVVMMDRNLGALRASYNSSDTFDFGLLYQWGRKDPFQNVYKRTFTTSTSSAGYAATVTGQQEARGAYGLTTETVSRYPHHFNRGLSSDYSTYATGVTSDMWAEDKTIFDPCPPGWKVPTTDMFSDQFIAEIDAQALESGGFQVPGRGWFPSTGYRFNIAYTGYLYGSSQYTFETGGGVANCIGNYHVRLWCSDGVFIKEKFLNEELASPSMLLPTGTYPYDAIKARSLYPNKLELLHGNSVRCVREDCHALPISTVQLNQSSATLGDGETVQLSATLLPEDTVNRTVTWESDDPSIATVSEEGLVTAIGPGTCSVTATAVGGASASCSVTVNALPFAWVDLGLPSGTLWGNMNMGAITRGSAGNGYLWAEASPYDGVSAYSWGTYNNYTKYCSADGLYIIQPDDDAATVYYADSNIHIPSSTQLQELLDGTNSQAATVGGMGGVLLTSTSNGNQLFFPAGFYWASDLYKTSNGVMWSYPNYLRMRDTGVDAEGVTYNPPHQREYSACIRAVREVQ